MCIRDSAEVSYYDWQVGELLKLLDKHELAENTLVMVVSEQGSSFPFAKWTCYEAGLQSAAIVRWPGKVKPQSESDAMIEYVDILPTFLSAAGGQPNRVFDGRSFLPVLSGETTTHKTHVFGIMTTRGIHHGSEHFGIRSVRDGQFKYIRNLTPEVPFQNVAMKDPAFKSWVAAAESGNEDAVEKVRRYQHRPAEELYKLSEDKFEWNNLAEDPSYAAVKSELSKRLDDWMATQGDKGAATEMAAKDRQWKRKRRK